MKGSLYRVQLTRTHLARGEPHAHLDIENRSISMDDGQTRTLPAFAATKNFICNLSKSFWDRNGMRMIKLKTVRGWEAAGNGCTETNCAIGRYEVWADGTKVKSVIIFFLRRYCVDSFDFDCQLNTLMRILCTPHTIDHCRTQLNHEIPLSQSSFSCAFFYCISSTSTDVFTPANLIGSALYYTRREFIQTFEIADTLYVVL